MEILCELRSCNILVAERINFLQQWRSYNSSGPEKLRSVTVQVWGKCMSRARRGPAIWRPWECGVDLTTEFLPHWCSCDSVQQSPCIREEIMPASNDHGSDDDGWSPQHHLNSSSNLDQNNTSLHGAGWRATALQIHPKVWLYRARQGQGNIV